MNQHQLVMTRGDTRDFDFSDITDPDGVAFNLAGASVSFTVDGLFTKTDLDGILVDESSGSIVAGIEPEDTEDTHDHRHVYRYEVQVTLADASVHTARRGLFILKPDLEAVT